MKSQVKRLLKQVIATAPRALRVLMAVVLAFSPSTLGVGVSSAQAQSVPTLMSFQGRLTDASNNPLSGSHSFVFEIFNALTGGTSLWTETQPAVTVTNGVFAVQLGAVTPLSATVFYGGAAYLQITADGVALSPRERLITSPYAFSSKNLDGRDYTFFVSTDAATQSIAGAKTFTGSITVPAPTSGLHAATRDYVDAQVSGGGSGWVDSGSVVRQADPTDNVVVAATLTVQGNAFSVGGSTLAVRNGNIGIGTTNPLDEFHMANPAGASQVRLLMQDTFSGSTAGNRVGRLVYDGGENITGGGWVFQKMTDAGAFSGNLVTIVQNTGNVGIGTADPGNRLSVSGAASFGGNAASAGEPIEAQGASAGISLYDRQGGSGERWVVYSDRTGGAGTNTLRLWSGSDKVGITSNGNLGIGTITPTYRLDVTGGGLIVRSSVTLAGISSTPNTVAGQGAIYYDTEDSKFKVSENGGAYTDLVTSGASAWTKEGAVIKAVTATDNVVVQSTLTVQGNAFSVGGSTLAVVSGQVGMGTTAPKTRLHLSTSSAGSVDLLTLEQNDATINNQAGLVFKKNADTMLGRIVAINQNPGADRSQMKFYTNDGSGTPVTNLSLLFNGNAGIGVEDPQARLELGGNGSQLYYSGTTDSNRLIANNQGTAYMGMKIYGIPGAASKIGLGYAPNISTLISDVLTVTNGDRVGIGNASPSTKLHVSSGTVMIDGDAATSFRIGASTLVVSGSGNVGIGTVSPTQGTLVINNTSNVNGLYVGNNVSATAPGIRSIGYSSDGADGGGGIEIGDMANVYLRIFRDSTNNFRFTTGASKIYFLPSDNIGIGTTNPASKLTILDGDLRISTSPSAASRGIIFQDGTTQITAAGAQGGGWTDDGTVVRLAASGDNVVVQSTLTVQGNAFSVGGSTFSVYASSVGIGTTSPAAMLEVKGRTRLGDSPPLANSDTLLLGDSGVVATNQSSSRLTSWGNSSAHGHLSYYPFHNASGPAGVAANQLFYFTGTSSAYNDFAVNLAVNGKFFLAPAAKNTILMELGDRTSVAGYSASDDSGRLLFSGKDFWNGYMSFRPKAATPRFYLTGASGAYDDTAVDLQVSGGGLFGRSTGIGTASPAATLHVSSAATAATEPIFIVSSGTAAGQELFRVRKDGNVGVGTTNPSEKLEASGNVKAADFITASGGALARRYYLTRALPTTANNYVEIGNFSLASGGHNLYIAVTASAASVSLAKQYALAIQYGESAGFWSDVLPIASAGSYAGSDFMLEINLADNETASLRLRRVSGAAAATAFISIEQIGSTSDSFTPASGTGASAATNPFFKSANFTQANGGVGAGVVQPQTLFQVRPLPSVTANFSIATSSPTFLGSLSNNGGSAPAATEPVLTLGREGVGGQSYANFADFKIGRYENVGTNARTQVDFGLTHGNDDAATTKVMSWRSDGNVGVGTTSPAAKLHVEGGDVLVGPSSIIHDATANADLFVQGNLVVDGRLVQHQGSQSTMESLIVEGTATVKGNAFSVGGSTFVVQGGTVSIGPVVANAAKNAFNFGSDYTLKLSHPNAGGHYASVKVNDAGPLDFFTTSDARFFSDPGGSVVIGNGVGFGILRIQNDWGEVGRFSTSAQDFIVENARGPNSGKLRLRTNSIDRVVLDASGNMGIGTTAPIAELHVSSANASPLGTPFLISSGTSSGQELLVVKGDGKVGVGTTSPTRRLEVAASGDDPAYLRIKGGPGGGTARLELMKGSAGTDHLVDFVNWNGSWMGGLGLNPSGNFVLYDASFNVPLFVNMGTRYVGASDTTAYSTMTVGGGLGLTGIGQPDGPAADRGIIYFDKNTDKFRVSENNGAFVDLVNQSAAGGWTDDGTVVRLTASGDNVVVQSTLTVQGAMGIGASGLSNGTLVVVSTSAISGNPVADFRNQGGTSLMQVQQGGNVGIGATNPSGKLDVRANLAYNGENGPLMATNSVVPTKMVSIGYDNAIDAGYLSSINSGSAWTNLIIQGGGGRVGVGTTSPSAKLDVRADVAYNAEGGPLMVTNSVVPTKMVSIGYDNAIDAGYISAIHSGSAWKNLILQGGTGKVGIGTVIPATPLDVNGAAQFGAGATKSTFSATGVLTFPSGYSPATALDAATKGYVDASGGGWTDDGTVVRLTASGDNAVVQSTLTVQGNAFSVGGSTFTVDGGTVSIGRNLRLADNLSTLQFGASNDVILSRDAANILAQRNGTSSQEFRVYRTLSGADSQYIALDFNAGDTAMRLRSDKTGASTILPLEFFGQGNSQILMFDGDIRMQAASGGMTRLTTNAFWPSDGTTIDLGLSSADHAFRDLFLQNSINFRAAGATPLTDVTLQRGGANTLALVRGTNAQEFRIYRTTSGADSEFMKAGWNTSGVFQVNTSTTGAGSRLGLYLSGGGTYPYDGLSIGADGTFVFKGGITPTTAYFKAGYPGASVAIGLTRSDDSLIGSILGDDAGTTELRSQGQYNAFFGRTSDALYRPLVIQEASTDAAAYYSRLKMGFGLSTAYFDIQAYQTSGEGTATPIALNPSGGSVGIGTTSPTHRLDVSGGGLIVRSSVTLAGISSTPNSVAGQGAIYYDTEDAKFKVSENAGSYVDLVPSGSSAWTKDGAVIKPVTATDNVVVQSTLTVQGAAFSVSDSTLSVSGGLVGIGTTAPSRQLTVKASAEANAGADFLDNGGNTMMTFRPSAGRIGVFNNNPAVPLDIIGQVQITGTGASSFVMRGGSGNTGFEINTAAAAAAGTSLGSFTDTRLRLQTNSVDRVTILNTGQVGIATGTPTAQLDVNGDAHFGSGAAKSTFTTTGNLQLVSGSTLTSNGTFSLSTAASAALTGDPALFVSASGKIGIGTASPASLLNLYATGSNQAQLRIDSGVGQANGVMLRTGNVERAYQALAAGADDVIAGSAQNDFAVRASQRILLSANGGTNAHMTIANSGGVGIGTTNPFSTMTITGALGFSAIGQPEGPAAGRGVIYYDTGANKLRVSENNGAFTDLVGGGGGWTDDGTVVRLTGAGDNAVIRSTLTVQGAVGIGASGLSAGTLVVRSTSTDAANPVVNVQNNAGTELMRIQQNGLVGVGTSNPEGLLHILLNQGAATKSIIENPNSGSAAQTSLEIRNAATPNASLRLRSMGTGFTTDGGFVQDAGVVETDIDLSGGLSLMTRASAPIRFYTAAYNNERMRISQSGFVGIGNTAPSTKLHVSSGTVMIDGDAATSFQIGASTLVVTGSGNVGIGTTDPAVALGDGGSPRILNLGGGAGYGLLRLTSTATGAGVSLGGITFGSSGYSGGEKRTAFIGSLSDDASTVNPTGHLQFWTTDTGTITEKLRITAGGKVGVGTTIPSSKFEVFNGSITIQGTDAGLRILGLNNCDTIDTNASGQFVCGSDAGGANGWIDAGTVVQLVASGDNVVIQSTLTVQGNAFSVGGSTFAVIGSSVGIGTTAPAASLDVDKGDAYSTWIRLGGEAATASKYLGLESGSSGFGVNSGFSGIEFGGPSSASEGYLAFHTHDVAVASDERMRIDKSGNVGIGTTGPNIFGYAAGNPVLTVSGEGASKTGILELAGNASADGNTGLISFHNTAAGGAKLGMITSDRTGANNSGSMRFWTTNAGAIAERLRIDPAGKVGIGNTAPSTKLHVSSGTVMIDGDAATSFQIGASTLVVTGSGNVGVGTTSPGAKLHVEGTAAFGTGATTLPATHANHRFLFLGTNAIGSINSAASELQTSANSYIDGPGSRRYTTTNPATLYEQAGGTHSWHYKASGAAGGLVNFTEAMRIDNSGKVGIGTTAPEAALHVVGVASVTASITVAGVSDASIPRGMVNFFNLTTCPTGWSLYTAANGRYVLGVNPSATVSTGTVVGTALSEAENRAVGQHSHSGAPNLASGGGGTNSIYATGLARGVDTVDALTTANSGSVAGTNAPYIQLLICSKD